MMHGPNGGHRSLPCTPQRTTNAQPAGHASLFATPQRQNTVQHNALGSQRRLAFGSAPQVRQLTPCVPSNCTLIPVFKAHTVDKSEINESRIWTRAQLSWRG
jgi:hypothetical protein